jgi:hypothetical protein
LIEKPPAPRLRADTPRRLPEVLRGPAHRDRRNAKSRLEDEEADPRTRPEPSLPLVKWLSRKDVV